MLPIEYKEALQALKDQASAVSVAIATGHHGNPVGLREAQQRMTERGQHVNIIVNLAMKVNKNRSEEDMIEIPQLTENDLLQLLRDNGLG